MEAHGAQWHVTLSCHAPDPSASSSEWEEASPTACTNVALTAQSSPYPPMAHPATNLLTPVEDPAESGAHIVLLAVSASSSVACNGGMMLPPSLGHRISRSYFSLSAPPVKRTKKYACNSEHFCYRVEMGVPVLEGSI